MAQTWSSSVILGAVLGLWAAPVLAQASGEASVEVAATFEAQRSLELSTVQNFWAEGGALEVGVNAFRGFGLAGNIAGVHAASAGPTGTALSLVTATFGPRYRWHDGRRYSLYAEGLAGEANGFRSLFPTPAGVQPDANALATRVGGGIDLRIGQAVRVRALEAAWLRTQFPNSGSNVQNNLVLGAGVVFVLPNHHSHGTARSR